MSGYPQHIIPVSLVNLGRVGKPWWWLSDTSGMETVIWTSSGLQWASNLGEMIDHSYQQELAQGPQLLQTIIIE